VIAVVMPKKGKEEDSMKKARERKKLGVYLATLCILLFVAVSPAWPQQVQKITSNRVKALLKAGKPAIGAAMILPSPPAAEILAQAGFDWLMIDLEHTALNLETVHRMIQATQGTETVPIVRIAWNLHWLAKPVLDMGVMGVIMPQVSSKQEAVDAVQALRYPPEGVRGMGPGFAALRWGLSIPEYLKIANNEIMAILLIEHIEAVNRIDEILTVPGIDLIFVGPGDLSASMGLLGQATHTRVEEAIQKVLAATKKAKVPAGITAFTPDDANRRIQQGFQFIFVGSDTGFLTAGAKGILGQIKK
jgi:2-keto-3-deoxy-L-rhamnonate aldolase RhmA